MNYLKGILIFAALIGISGCLTTDEFNKARELNRADDELHALVVKVANHTDDTNNEQKQRDRLAISTLAEYAQNQASSLARNNDNNLAIGFYRIATTGFWKDGIDSNNSRFFDSVDAAQTICTGMDNPPDRDCFFLAFAPMFASIEESINDEKFYNLSSLRDDQELAEAKALVASLGARGADNPTQMSIEHGSLVNAIVLAAQRQSFLEQHMSFNRYVCSNLSNVLDLYFSRVNMLLRNLSGERAEINQQNPMYVEYRQLPAGTSHLAYLKDMLPSCDKVL